MLDLYFYVNSLAVVVPETIFMRCLTSNFCVDEAFLHFSGHFLPVLNRDSFTVLVSGRYIESSQTDEWSQSSKNSLKS